MNLQFKETENFKAYHEPGGLNLRNGDIAEVSEEKGKELLKDYPKNFSKVTVQEIEIDLESIEVEEAEPEEKKSFFEEEPPDKMVTEAKPSGQKRKGKQRR